MEPTDEQKGRMNSFMEKYRVLVEETKMDFANYPVYVPDGQGGFRTIVQSTPVDTSGMSIPSPFIPE